MFANLEYPLQAPGWDFAQTVFELREGTSGENGKKLTLKDVAQVVALSRSSLFRLERGAMPVHQLSIHQVDGLCQALIDPMDSADSNEDLAHLLGAYSKEWLEYFEDRTRARTTPLQSRFLSVPISIMVDLWIASNDLANNPSDTIFSQALHQTFQRALKAETNKPNIFISNPYRNVLLADKIDKVTKCLSKKFNVILADRRSPASTISQLESCWAYVLVSSSNHPDSSDWQEQLELASSLKIPIIGLFTDLAPLNDEQIDDYYLRLLLDDPDVTGDKLLSILSHLVSLGGQDAWWRSLSSAMGARPRSENERPRIYGIPPQGLGELFVGRAAEIDQIRSMLLSSETSKRAVIIFGWNVGKTALACQVLKELPTDEHSIDGLVYLPGDIDIEELYRGIAHVLGRPTTLALKNWLMSGLDPLHRGKYLLGKLGRHRIVILLDGFEHNLDANGQIQDPELAAFLREFLIQDHNGRLLITSNQRLELDVELTRHVYVFSLNSGLATPDGVTMLHKLDSDGVLAHTDSAVLEKIVEKVQGFPKPLLLISSLLTNAYDRVSPERLLENESLIFDTLTDKLAKTIQARLTPDAQRIMQALSVLARPGVHLPITTAAIAALLDDAGSDLESALDLLEKLSCIKWDRGKELFEIHTWDQRFYYEQISRDRTDTYNFHVLERRAAEYYHREIPNDGDPGRRFAFDWTELDHWMKGEDYASALALLEQMSADPLNRWDHDSLVQEGYFSRLVGLRLEIAASLTENTLVARNFHSLARVYLNVGQYREASHYFELALQNARQFDDYLLRSHCLVGIGHCEHAQQYYERAVEAYQQALDLLNRTDDSYTRAICLDEMAAVRRDQGNLHEALDYSRQALTVIQTKDDPRARSVQAKCLETQARIYRYLVLSDEAQKLHQQALIIQQDLHDRQDELYVSNRLGMVSQDLGEWSVEEQYQRRALVIAEQIGDLRGQSKAWERLGYLQVILGHYDVAHDYIERAFSLASNINARRIIGYCHFRFGQIHLARGAFDVSLGEFSQARIIFDNTENRFDQQDCRNQIAKLHLIIAPDQPDLSLNVLQDALACNVEFYNHQSLLLKAITLLYAMPGARVEIREGFAAAQDAAERILVQTPRFYEARFTRALALAGVLLLNDPGGSKRDTDLERRARIACSDLYHYRDYAGETAEVLRLLKMIRTFDPDDLLASLEVDLIKAIGSAWR